MSGTMSQADLVTDLKASMLDAANNFLGGDADFQRHLNNAADDLSRIAPERVRGSLGLVSGQALYDAPADFKSYQMLLWGEHHRNLPTWDPRFPGRLPSVTTVMNGTDRQLQFSPPPNARQIAHLGAAAPFMYVQAFHVDADAALTTVPASRRGLLLLRAQAEAMKELAARGSAKPVQLRDGMTQGPRNGSPAALYETFMDECDRQAQAA